MNQYQFSTLLFAAPGLALVEGLADMISGGRITEADVPDDWQWLQVAMKEAEQERRLMKWAVDYLEEQRIQASLEELAQQPEKGGD